MAAMGEVQLGAVEAARWAAEAVVQWAAVQEAQWAAEAVPWALRLAGL